MILNTEELQQLRQLSDPSHPMRFHTIQGRYAIPPEPEYQWARDQVADWRVQRGEPALIDISRRGAA